MSPILKRDIGEQVRHARRLAAAITGEPSLAPNEDEHQHGLDSRHPVAEGSRSAFAADQKGFDPPDTNAYASGSAKRGIELDEPRHTGGGLGVGNGWKQTKSVTTGVEQDSRRAQRKGKARLSNAGDSPYEPATARLLNGHGEPSGVHSERANGAKGSKVDMGDMNADEEAIAMLSHSSSPDWKGRIPRGGEMGLDDGLEQVHARVTAAQDLRNLLTESTPSLLLSLVGLVFTGELLEHLARWRVFRRVDELFILVPMLGNLKGNLEMCLSARLGTSANIGELDHRQTRRALIVANLTLLGLQALLISCLAAVVSFALGLATVHRLGDGPGVGAGPGNGTAVGGGMLGSGVPLDPGLAVGEQEWHEGYTRPGWKQLVMVLATGMGAAGISSAMLGSFMANLVLVCRWAGLNPDNITPPVAACLGDDLTLFILALLGTLLVGVMDTPIPLVAVVLMGLAAAEFTRRVMRNQWVKNVAKGGWAPLIGAMLISSGTGMVLDKGVAKYRGFALLAISMTGLTGSIGAIHANRLSTALHTNLHPASLQPRHGPAQGLSPLAGSLTLFLLAFPCQAAFLVFVSWAGWIDLGLGWAGWLAFALTTAISLTLSHFLTLFFWSKDLDPDSYTLPIHSALVDFLGQLVLMLAYELCIAQGLDVLVKDIVM